MTMSMQPMWRGEMNKYYVFKKNKFCTDGAESIHISLVNDEDMLNSFIDIYPDCEDAPSPLKNIDDAEIFARAIVKLLESVDVMVNKDDIE